ncbi:MAG TPA: serine hydrolase [Robiginitalea sp.]|nr:serine hydrolase [Robiginitalea sp.]
MKPVYALFTALFIFYASPAASQAPAESRVIAGFSLDRFAHYENYVKREIGSGNIPGAVTLVARDGETVYKSAVGLSDPTEKRDMKTDDIFYIQSMTKPIITTAFMMLFEEGHFLLTDPLSKYLPAAKDLRVLVNVEDGIGGETVPLKRDILLMDLLSHTAGFTHGLGPSRYDREMFGALARPYNTIQERVDAYFTMPLLGQPGEQWAYSIAPDILSVLIEKFSGQSTDAFLKERIFEPLWMKDTGYNLTREQQGRVVRVQGEDPGGALSTHPKMEGNTVWSGVNALFSTAEDYLHFCQMLLDGGRWHGKQLLSRKTVELMTLNHSGDLFGGPGEGFGYGFAVVDDLAATNNLGSQGVYYWAGAFNTHFFIDPKERLISIFMTQTSAFDFYYHNKLRQLVYQAIAD